MLRLEHIGIAVSDLSTSVPLFEKLLNSQCYKKENVETEQVTTAFFQIDNSKVELLESTDPEGVIARFIRKKGEGLHHVAFEVDDIVEEVARLTEAGFSALNAPKRGADNKMVVFLHPKKTGGVLIELVQSIR